MATITDYNTFLASEPEAQLEYLTIEVYHPAFGSTYRFVNQFRNKDLTLEAGAPRDASTSVTFTSLYMKIAEPEVSDDGNTVLSVELGAVSGEIQEIIDSLSGTDYFQEIEVIYRKYYSGDLSAPVTVFYLTGAKVTFSGYVTASINAEDSDFINKNSGQIYTLQRFPMLEDGS